MEFTGVGARGSGLGVWQPGGRQGQQGAWGCPDGLCSGHPSPEPRVPSPDARQSRLPQRARAAALAMARRRLALRAAARAGPPLRPPRRPRAAACGFGSCASVRRAMIPVRSVGAWQRVQAGPMSSVPSGSVTCWTKSQTRQRRSTVRRVVAVFRGMLERTGNGYTPGAVAASTAISGRGPSRFRGPIHLRCCGVP